LTLTVTVSERSSNPVTVALSANAIPGSRNSTAAASASTVFIGLVGGRQVYLYLWHKSIVNMARLLYFGHSGFQITYSDGTVVMIDPFFSGEGRDVPAAVKDAHWVKNCDLILLTHEHVDHFEPSTVTEIAERTWASVVAPQPVLSKLRLPDRQKVDVRVGDKFELKGVSIEVVKAVHPQSEYPVGYIIEKEEVRIYHAGDTYEFSQMEDFKCDWALIPIGGTYTMDSIGAEKAAKEIKCKYAVPTHYATWGRIAPDAQEFVNGLRGAKVKPVVMKPGDEVEASR